MNLIQSRVVESIVSLYPKGIAPIEAVDQYLSELAAQVRDMDGSDPNFKYKAAEQCYLEEVRLSLCNENAKLQTVTVN